VSTARRTFLRALLLSTAAPLSRAAAQSSCSEPETANARLRTEAMLLHRRVSLAAMSRFDVARGGFTRANLSTDGRPLLIHLWATFCRPCRDELPSWHHFVWDLHHESALRAVFIAEDADIDRLTEFFFTYRGSLPAVEHYQVSPLSHFRDALHTSSLPLTLLLDGQQVVRQAFIGPIQPRKQEILSAAQRLRFSLKARPNARHFARSPIETRRGSGSKPTY
jgi:thiol-disulfide isomerase/thioredoxin